MAVEGGLFLCTDQDTCFCRTEEIPTCSSEADCPDEAEGCIQNLCLSKARFGDDDTADSEPEDTPSPGPDGGSGSGDGDGERPGPEETSDSDADGGSGSGSGGGVSSGPDGTPGADPGNGLGFNGDPCEDSSDCAGDRRCFEDSGEELLPCGGTSACFCRGVAVPSCTGEADCPDEEESCSRGLCISNNLLESEDDGPQQSSGPEGTEEEGFNLDPCKSNAGCAGERVCLVFSGDALVACEPGDSDCFCRTREVPSCVDQGDCPDEEESCFIGFCRSNENIKEADPSFDPTATPGPGKNGFNGEPCSSTDDCAGERICFFGNTETNQPENCASRSDCFCRTQDIPSCESQEECVDEEEECVQGACRASKLLTDNNPNITDTPPTPIPTEVAKLEDPSPEPSTEDEVCIGANALTHLPMDELVYSEHRRSRVLCDVKGSCATAGHMVVWNGKGMMMRKYCEVVGGCAVRVMWVNSPKYRRGIMVRSRSEGLMFTAFAARYGTHVEEAVMKAAMRMGL